MKIKNIFFGVCITVLLLTIIFIIPVIINELYKTREGYYTVWSGADALAFYGSIMSFIGTAFISIIALYQNKKFKEENDKIQKRTEEISIRANELNSINKIIEYESLRFDELKNWLNEIQKISRPLTLHIGVNSQSTIEEKEFDILLQKVFQELQRDSKENMQTLYISLANMKLSFTTIAFENIINNIPDKDKIYEEHRIKWMTFVDEKTKYLLKRQTMLDNVIYENLSLDEVKKIFSKTSDDK